MNKGGIKLFVTIMLLAIFAVVTGLSIYNYFKDPDPKDNGKSVAVKDQNAGKTESKKASETEDIVIGDAGKDGASLAVNAGVFPEGTEITLKHLTDKEAKEYKTEGVGLISNPIEVGAAEDVYKGECLDEGVTLVVDIPQETIKEDSSPVDFCFAYFDETMKAWRYLEPDWVDLDERKMQITLQHFSIYGPATPDEAAQIDRIMNQYCEAKLRHENSYNEAEQALSPYLADLKKKINLSEKAFNQLQRDILCQVMDNLQGGGPETPGLWRDKSQKWHFQGQGTLITTCMKAKEDNDPDLAAFAIEEYMAEATASVLFNGPWAKKIAMGGRLAKAAGSFAGGDYEQAVRDLIDISLNFTPYGYVKQATVDFVIKKADEQFTRWKKDEVDELYQIYKNGREGRWTSIEPQNFEELWEYVDYGFFAKGRAVERLFSQEQLKQQLINYGWSETTYKNLPEAKKKEFQKKTREQLENYFKARLENEKKIEKMKKEEADFIEDILPTLRDSSYMDFFGEKRYRDIKLDERLRKLLEFRNAVADYVDLDKMDKNGVYWGPLVNQMISEFDKDLTNEEQLQVWLKLLDDEGVLLDELKGLLDVSIFGKWEVTQVINDVGSDYFDAYIEAMGGGAGMLPEEYKQALEEYQKLYGESYEQYKNQENKGTMTIEDTLGDTVSVVIVYDNAPDHYLSYTGTYDENSKVLTLTNDNPENLDPGLELQFGTMDDRPYFEGKVDYKSDIVTYSYNITGYKITDSEEGGDKEDN
ncbi:hypothetical protein SAMN04487934_10375 [Eubacterium ruminantium]|nr:hypothetical protein SAMN04487934_10375 [Eubacterium ruminantium]